MTFHLELNGRRALVTGGTKGVGEAVVASLLCEDVKVLTTARSSPTNLAAGLHFVAADVSTTEGCASIADAVRDRLGGVDIIVHVVGGSSAPAGGFAVLDDTEWHKALDQNLFGAVRLDRALVPAMIEQGSGVVIHITSIQDWMPLPEAHHCLRRSESGTLELQQGPVQGSQPQGRARRPRFARLGRDGWRGRISQGDRATERHRLRGRPQDCDG